jgi:hypothetical protein
MNTEQEDQYLSALKAARAKFEREVSELAEKIRDQVIIPLCLKHGLTFISGNGTFFFTDVKGNDYTSDDVDAAYAGNKKIHKAVSGVLHLLNEEVSHNQVLGYYVGDVR